MRYFTMIAALALGGLAPRLDAQAQAPQTLRRFTTFRQSHNERTLTARLWLTHSVLTIVPSRPGELYRAAAVYDDWRFRPVTTFDTATNSLRLHMARKGKRRDAGRTNLAIRIPDDVPSDERQSLELALSRQVNTEFQLMLGNTDADLDLGEFRVAAVDVTAGAGTTEIRFSQPNPITCRTASIRGGVGKLSLLRLGNSRCEKISLQGGVGEAVLDFGGTWSADAAVEASMTVGQLTLQLPRAIGVRITPKTVLAKFAPSGLLRDGEAFVSPNYATATRHLTIDLETTLGVVDVEWIDE